MTEAFIDCTTLAGQRRIRDYVQGWLERLDYAGRLDREWPPEELAARVWERVERDFAAVWPGPVVENRDLARVVATAMVEDYHAAYPVRRVFRYAVRGGLPDATFRRCVLDFLHDLEEYEPAELSRHPEVAASAFWSSVRTSPERWGVDGDPLTFVDDAPRAHHIAVEVIRDYFDLQARVERRRAEA
jgi:hypothetical protein